MKNHRRSLSLSTVSLLVLLAACATVPITGRKQLALLPESELVPASYNSYRQLLQESKLSKDPARLAMLRTVGKNIAASAEQFLRDNGAEEELRFYQWEFNLIDDDKNVNAFCMPGGKVAVYTGILPVTEDSNGLAVVLGHEVAHALAHHGNERMSQLLLVQLGGMGLARALREKPRQTQELLLTAFGLGANLGILLPYSRSQESEADRIGLILMALAGYDPHTAVAFWQRMSAKGGAAPPEFLSTHPSGERRIEEIKDRMPEAMKYYKK